MVFKGLVTNKEDVNKLILTPLVRYPLLGGSALITFEKAEGKSQTSAAAARCPLASDPALQPFPGLGFGALPPWQHYVGLCPVSPTTRSEQGARSPVLGALPAHSGPEDHRPEGARGGAELRGGAGGA